MPASYITHRAQIEAVLQAWGMKPDYAAQTAEVMAWADLHGIDSHGMSMLTVYDPRRRDGRIRMEAEPRLVKETPVSAMVDGDAGLGHVPSRMAMQAAIGRAQGIGVGVATVHHSSHFGACGFYAKMAADAGLIGMIATSASNVVVAPTGGAQARLGTDPLAFAAPARDDRPFLLDMATTTVAAGRIRNKANENQPCPPGWVVTRDGATSTDPREATEKGGFMTPLGGTREGSSYKGYGLSMMVNVLSACLSGSTLITDPMHTKTPKGMDIGHFFLALNPALFRDADAFRDDVSTLCDTLRATRPADPAFPVQVAGDPERAHAARRMKDGIPVGRNLLAKIQTLAEDAGAPWLMGEA